MDFNGNLQKQEEEIVALSSIYGEDWIPESDTSFSIKILENKKEAVLYVTFPPDYPEQSPPKYELSAPWMSRSEKQCVHTALDKVYSENVGELVVYEWVEKIRHILRSFKSHSKRQKSHKNETPSKTKMEVKCPEITHGEVIIDRKSCFQGHAAEVHSLEEVQAVLEKLKNNKKIMNATHNMYAYRFAQQTARGIRIVQECDNDGENQAGGRMLHLLEVLDQRNALVVVSRWYGGIQLGADRFRHINNSCRQALLRAGLLTTQKRK